MTSYGWNAHLFGRSWQVSPCLASNVGGGRFWAEEWNLTKHSFGILDQWLQLWWCYSLNTIFICIYIEKVHITPFQYWKNILMFSGRSWIPFLHSTSGVDANDPATWRHFCHWCTEELHPNCPDCRGKGWQLYCPKCLLGGDRHGTSQGYVVVNVSIEDMAETDEVQASRVQIKIGACRTQYKVGPY